MQAKPEAALSSTILLAFSRVFSGVVKKGQELYVLQPRYDLREAILEGQMGLLPPHVCKFTVEGLYTLVGRSVLPVESVSAGNIVGIAGMEESIVKSGTISSTLACPAFSTMVAVASPIVRVAIEPLHVSDLPALVSGMKLLNQVDPSVKVYVQDTGEHVLAAAGEVHLQKCLDDLEKQYACVKLNVSEPIIPFRETVVIPPKVDMVNEDISVENEFKFVTQAHGEASFPLRFVFWLSIIVQWKSWWLIEVYYLTVQVSRREINLLLPVQRSEYKLPTRPVLCCWRHNLCQLSVLGFWKEILCS